MRRALRILARVGKWGGIILGSLAVLALVLVTLMLATPLGGRLGQRVAQRVLPELSVARFDGRLGGRFTVHEVRYEAEGLSVAVERVEVDWRLTALFSRSVHVRHLGVHGVDVTVGEMPADTNAAPADSTAPAGPFAMPIDIVIDEALVERVQLVLPDSLVVAVPRVRAAGTPDRYTVEVEASAASPAMPSIAMTANAHGNLTRATLDPLHANLLDGFVTIVGDVTWTPHIEWKVSVVADSIAPAQVLPDTARFAGTVSARVDTEGRLLDDGRGEYRLRAEVNADLAAFPSANVFLSASGDFTGAAIDTMRASLLDGVVTASGSVSWEPRLQWELAVDVDSFVPAPLMPSPAEWPGWVSVRARTSGTIDDAGEPDLSVELSSLQGQLREESVEGRASVTLRGTRIEFSELALGWGPASVDASGHIDEDIAVDFDIAVPELALIVPLAGGSIRASGRAEGPMTRPAVTCRVRGDSLSYVAMSARRVTLDAQLDPTDPGSVSLDARVFDFAGQDRVVDSLVVLASGNIPDHELSLLVEAAEGHAELSIAGGIADSTWTGAIERLSIRHITAGAWRLGSPAKVSASMQSARVDTLCLLAADTSVVSGARVCVGGAWDAAAGWSGGAEVVGVSLAMVEASLPEDFNVTGDVNLRASGSGGPGRPVEGSLRLTVGPGEIVYRVADVSHRARYDSTFVHADANADGVIGRLRSIVKMEDGTTLANVAGDWRIPFAAQDSLVADSLALTAKLMARIEDLSALGAAVPALGQTSGKVIADVNVDGTVTSPQVTGDIRLTDSRVSVPEVGLDVYGINFTATGAQDGTITLSGAARSHGGDLSVSGDVALGAERGTRARIEIKGQRFAVMNTPEAEVYISPDVTTVVDSGRVNITGRLAIPYARIVMIEVPQSAVAPSSDVIIIGQEEDGVIPMDVTAQVRIALGDSVTFRGLGLYARLSGSLLIKQRPGELTLGTGELNIHDGEYFAYGQKLLIDPGRLIFVGPLDDPGLDVRAFRRTPDNVVAGLRVRGTARRPEAEVYSEPAMSQADALSYLLTGRPMDNSSGSENQLLAAAALGMGLQQGSALAHSMGSSVGLDEARIDAGSNLDDAALVAGKHITPEIYVSQTIGLFNNTRMFRVRYTLTSKWTVQAETGTFTGSDLLYRIERGGKEE